MVPIDGLTTGAVAILGKSSRLAVKVALVIWVVAAVVWWAAGWTIWWGPEPSAGLLVYAVLGAGMVLPRFTWSARAGSGPR